MADVAEQQTSTTTDENTEKPENKSLLSGNDSDNTTEENKVDYSYVPDKFMKDGNPNFENLAKSYTELEKKLSQRNPEAPESVDHYSFDEENPFRYEDQLDAESFSQFKQEMYDLGITNRQYQAMMDWYQKRMDELPHLQDHSEALKGKWGDNFDSNIKAANNAVAKYFPQGDLTKYPELANHPVFVEVMANIGKASKESVTNIDHKQTETRSGYSAMEIEDIRRSSDYGSNITKQRIVENYYKAKHGE